MSGTWRASVGERRLAYEQGYVQGWVDPMRLERTGFQAKLGKRGFDMNEAFFLNLMDGVCTRKMASDFRK